MKVGDLVKYIPTSLEDNEGTIGVIVAVTSIWYSVLWVGDAVPHGYTEDSLEVINESR